MHISLATCILEVEFTATPQTRLCCCVLFFLAKVNAVFVQQHLSDHSGFGVLEFGLRETSAFMPRNRVYPVYPVYRIMSQQH